MVSVPPCFWSYNKAAHHGGEYVTEHSCTPHGQEKKREKEPTTLFKDAPLITWTYSSRLHLLKFILLPNSRKLNIKPLTHGSLKPFQSQTTSSLELISRYAHIHHKKYLIILCDFSPVLFSPFRTSGLPLSNIIHDKKSLWV
jgi:hypothetical protein